MAHEPLRKSPVGPQRRLARTRPELAEPMPQLPATAQPVPLRSTELLALQRAVGNRAVGRMLLGAGSASTIGAVPGRTIQRVRVDIYPLLSQAGITEHLRDVPMSLNTDDPTRAKHAIDALYNNGLISIISQLKAQISAGSSTTNDTATNDTAVLQYIAGKLGATTASVAENKPSGFFEEKWFDLKNRTTAPITEETQKGLRMWITGDPARGFGWNTICQHMRGLLEDKEYHLIGYMYYAKADQDDKTAKKDLYTDDQKKIIAQQLLDAAASDISGALDAIPAYDGVSYRQYGPKDSTVYAGKIRVGDYIRDTTFWSTSALRIDGSAGKWGHDGTKAKPKVYFIITGSTGRYISPYAKQEEGQREILFKSSVTFEVTKIANFRDETFFVHVTEVDPHKRRTNQRAKNPYDGASY